MKTFALAAVLAVLGTAALAADPVEGTWKTKPDDNGNFGHVQIKPCGPAFCGTLVKAFDGSGKQIESPNVGRQIVWDMVAYGDGFYDDGKVYSPDRDKTYNSEMQLSGNSLTVKGCVLGICRDGGTWTRVK
ncbi:DUF2147 domain-containing protein [Neotabrizicola sp. VNH66]|uniref:DUF2147 domain-containing protein n=1 Tax=Neotabrizicola sp. VNH66 TaxID=3400918 RepID=UPI003BFEC1E5